MKLNFCEEFKVCLVNSGCKILCICSLSIGGISATLIDIRHAVAAALLANAPRIILAHNHPPEFANPASKTVASLQPSKKQPPLFNIKVVDYFIVSDCTFFSFAREGFN